MVIINKTSCVLPQCHNTRQKDLGNTKRFHTPKKKKEKKKRVRVTGPHREGAVRHSNICLILLLVCSCTSESVTFSILVGHNGDFITIITITNSSNPIHPNKTSSRNSGNQSL